MESSIHSNPDWHASFPSHQLVVLYRLLERAICQPSKKSSARKNEENPSPSNRILSVQPRHLKKKTSFLLRFADTKPSGRKTTSGTSKAFRLSFRRPLPLLYPRFLADSFLAYCLFDRLFVPTTIISAAATTQQILPLKTNYDLFFQDDFVFGTGGDRPGTDLLYRFLCSSISRGQRKNTGDECGTANGTSVGVSLGFHRRRRDAATGDDRCRGSQGGPAMEEIYQATGHSGTQQQRP